MGEAPVPAVFQTTELKGNTMAEKIQLRDVRLSFPVLWKAEEFKAGDGKPRFSANLLVTPGSAADKQINAAIKKVAAEAWKEKAEKMLKAYAGQKNQYCYRDGDLSNYDGYDGLWFLAAHSKVRPTVIDRNREPLDAASGRPYAGCYVNAIVEIYVQEGENPGIRAGLSGIQFVRDGEAFGGGRPASADEFDDLSGDDSGSDDSDDMA